MKLTLLSFHCKAFTAHPEKENMVAVFPDQTVCVWDSIAQFYTTCHTLTSAQQDEIRRLASERGVTGTFPTLSH